MPHPSPDVETYRRLRPRLRRRPAWLLRRRERRIVARHTPPGARPRPSAGELAELAAIRRELLARSAPAPRRRGPA